MPRSRTAWWSVVTTTPQSICRHEPLKDSNSSEELAAVWSDPKVDYVGVSDSGVVPILGRILEEIEPRTLIVERPAAEAMRSFENYMRGFEFNRQAAALYFETSARMLRNYHDHPLVKVVKFSDMSDPDAVAQAYRWLMPKNAWPVRFELLHINVQVDVGYVVREAMKAHSHWYRQ